MYRQRHTYESIIKSSAAKVAMNFIILPTTNKTKISRLYYLLLLPPPTYIQYYTFYIVCVYTNQFLCSLGQQSVKYVPIFEIDYYFGKMS